MSGSADGVAVANRQQRPPSAARERILETVDRLFYDEGIQAVGVHRIVSEAAVTRVTLYRHFASKDELILAYLQRRAQHDRDQVTDLIADRPDDPRGALRELAVVLTRDDFGAIRRGCPFINAAAEFADGHPARAQAADIRTWIVDRLTDLLARLGHRSPSGTARQLMMVRTGAVVSGALDHDGDLNRNFVDCWNALIDTGLPRPA
jgi:AcrR family transcriptional regulator